MVIFRRKVKIRSKKSPVPKEMTIRDVYEAWPGPKGHPHRIEILSVIASGLPPHIIRARLKAGQKITNSRIGKRGALLELSDGTAVAAWETWLGKRYVEIKNPTKEQLEKLNKKIGRLL